MSELNWSYVHRMEAAADRMSQAADRVEAAAQRLANMLEDGYGGNGLRLIELLERENHIHRRMADVVKANTGFDSVTELVVAYNKLTSATGILGTEPKEFAIEVLTLVNGQPFVTRRPLSEWPSWAVGYCAEGEACQCGGDTIGVKTGCVNWRSPQ